MAVVNVLSFTPKDVKRFWAKVDIQDSNACWLWKGTAFQNGYGEFHKQQKKMGTHCVSWKITFGDIPDGVCVLHDCPGGDNRLCVNPNHLWLGTRGENNTDTKEKGRMLTGEAWKAAHLPGIRKGLRHPGTIRCQRIYDQRDQIIKKWMSGESTQVIADRLGCSQTLIYRIVKGLV